MNSKIFSFTVFLMAALFGNTFADAAMISKDDIKSNNVLELGKAIKNGADVNAKDEVGNTPLMFAASFCSLEAAKLLIDKDADINATNSGGVTALLMATALPVHKDSVEIVKLLLEKGADVNVKSKYGDTAIKNVTYCSHANCLQIASLLKQYGAVEVKPIEPSLEGIYHLKEATIKFFPPNEWKQFQQDSTIFILFQPIDNKDTKLYIAVDPFSGESFNSFIEKDKESSKNRAALTLQENETLFLNSNAYVTVRVNNGIKKEKSISFYKNNKIFRILFVAKTQDFERFLPLVEKSLESFEIREK